MLKVYQLSLQKSEIISSIDTTQFEKSELENSCRKHCKCQETSSRGREENLRINAVEILGKEKCTVRSAECAIS